MGSTPGRGGQRGGWGTTGMGAGEMETARGDYPMISGRVSTGVWGGGGQAQGEGKGRA